MTISPRRVRQIYLWHKWTALISGLFVLFVSLTGTLAVFKNEIDATLTPGRSVTPQTSTRAPLESVVASMNRAYPGRNVSNIDVADPRLAWDVDKVSIKVKQPDGESVSREIFFNPWSGRITGSREGEDLANVIRQAHLRFYYFGWQGRVAVGVVGLALLISTITGWLIYKPFMKKLVWGRMRWKQRLQLVVSDWHKMIGFAAIVFNLVIALTGAVLGLENLARFSDKARQTMHPAPSKAIKKQVPATIENRLTVDEAVAKVQGAIPGFVATRINLPRAKKSNWLIRGDVNGHFSARGTSWAVVQAVNGQVLEKHDARAAAPLTRAYNLSEPLHFGDFAGVPIRVLYLLLGLFSSSLSITGFWLWALKNWKRTPKQTREISSSVP